MIVILQLLLIKTDVQKRGLFIPALSQKKLLLPKVTSFFWVVFSNNDSFNLYL